MRESERNANPRRGRTRVLPDEAIEEGERVLRGFFWNNLKGLHAKQQRINTETGLNKGLERDP